MASNKPKILFLHHGTGIGGASLCLNELILSLGDKIQPTVLCIKHSSAISLFEESGIATVCLDTFFYKRIYSFWPHIEGTSYNLTSIIQMPRVVLSYFLNSLYFSKKALKNFDFDLLYLNSTFLTDWTILNKKSVILHVREPLAKGLLKVRYTFFKYIINKYVDQIIAISQDNAKRINLRKKTTVVYDPMRKVEFESIVNKDSSNKYYLYLGGLQMIKGFYVLASSLKYLDSTIKIFFAGNTNLQARTGIVGNLKKLIEQYWLYKIRSSNNIIEIGHISNVYDYFKASDFLLFPSTIPHFAGPVLEAYSVGKPVIVSDVSGMEEIVTQKTGFFFKKGNAKNLAEVINYSSRISVEQYFELEVECYKKSIFFKYNDDLIYDEITKILKKQYYQNF